MKKCRIYKQSRVYQAFHRVNFFAQKETNLPISEFTNFWQKTFYSCKNRLKKKHRIYLDLQSCNMFSLPTGKGLFTTTPYLASSMSSAMAELFRHACSQANCSSTVRYETGTGIHQQPRDSLEKQQRLVVEILNTFVFAAQLKVDSYKVSKPFFFSFLRSPKLPKAFPYLPCALRKNYSFFGI